MLKSLYKFGKYIDETEGIEKAFEKDFKTPKEGDKILKISVDKKEKIHSKILEAEKDVDIEKKSLYYVGGGGDNVTGNQGIMVISPFFFQLKYLSKNKISKSKGYYNKKIYKKEIEDLDIIKHYFSFLEKNSDSIKGKKEEGTADSTWIYVSDFKGESTLNLHQNYVNLYPLIKRNEEIDDIVDVCDICNNRDTIRYPKIPFYSLDKGCYNHNMNRNELKNARIKICRNCEAYITAGWKFLLNIFNRNYLMIPILKKPEDKKRVFETFIEAIRGQNLSNFEKINATLNKDIINKNLELYFIVYSKDNRGGFGNLESRIRNYKLYSLKFDPKKNENLRLLQNDDKTLRYINYSDPNYNSSRKIENFFDIEKILKSFFIMENGNIPTFYFYELYFKNPPKRMNNQFKHRLYKYRNDLVSFIYNCDPSAINEKILRDIVLNFLLYEIKNKRDLFDDPKYEDLNLRNEIMERINYYRFLNEKIINRDDCVMLKNQIQKLDDFFKNFEDDDKEKIKEIVLDEKNKQLLYYLIGNFIQKIDNTRGREEKNKVFENFISNINERNIKNRFQKDILQRQNYYIKERSRKVKFILDLIKYHLDDLFKDLPYEEIMISLITGYYSEDILKSEKSNSNGGG